MAQNLTGNISDSQLPANVARLNGTNAFSGTNHFAGVMVATNANNIFNGTFTGSLSAMPRRRRRPIIFPAALRGCHGNTRRDRGCQRWRPDRGERGRRRARGQRRDQREHRQHDCAARCVGQFFGFDHHGGQFERRLSGDGSGLTNLNPANLSAGTAAINISGNAATATAANSVNGPIALSNVTGTLPAAVVQASLPSGITVVSMLAQDASLLTNGYQFLMTVPPPPWVSGSTTDAPSARSGHSAIWDGQQMIVWGGNAGSGTPAYVNTGGLYDPVADQWTAISPIDAPDARSGHASVWTGSQMIVWGGANDVSAFLNTGGRYQPSPQQWNPVSTANAPAGRSGHVAVWTGSAMFIWGGQNPNGLLNDGALYDPVGNQWTALNLANPPEARINATAVWAGDRVIIWGGVGAGGPLNDGGELIFSSGAPSQWVATTLAGAPAGRSGHSAVWPAGR